MGREIKEAEECDIAGVEVWEISYNHRVKVHLVAVNDVGSKYVSVLYGYIIVGSIIVLVVLCGEGNHRSRCCRRHCG